LKLPHTKKTHPIVQGTFQKLNSKLKKLYRNRAFNQHHVLSLINYSKSFRSPLRKKLKIVNPRLEAFKALGPI
jgi:hypothetical protein